MQTTLVYICHRSFISQMQKALVGFVVKRYIPDATSFCVSISAPLYLRSKNILLVSALEARNCRWNLLCEVRVIVFLTLMLGCCCCALGTITWSRGRFTSYSDLSTSHRNQTFSIILRSHASSLRHKSSNDKVDALTQTSLLFTDILSIFWALLRFVYVPHPLWCMLAVFPRVRLKTLWHRVGVSEGFFALSWWLLQSARSQANVSSIWIRCLFIVHQKCCMDLQAWWARLGKVSAIKKPRFRPLVQAVMCLSLEAVTSKSVAFDWKVACAMKSSCFGLPVHALVRWKL